MDWIQDRIVYRLHLIVSNGLYPIDRIQDCIVYQGLYKKRVYGKYFKYNAFENLKDLIAI